MVKLTDDEDDEMMMILMMTMMTVVVVTALITELKTNTDALFAAEEQFLIT